ncbi:MAG: sulfotransferase family 2 domain-containing protein [Cycloclasticus sp.]
MVINDEYKFIFIHIPKVAGTSISKQLRLVKGNNRRLLANTKHETLKDFLQNWRGRSIPFVTKNPEAYFRFAFVRNPWARMYSFFNYLKAKRPRKEVDAIDSFKQFLLLSCDPESWVNQFHSMRPQVDYLVAMDGEVQMNFVGHYEYLNEDLKAIGFHLGLNIEIPHLNKSFGLKADYKDAYDLDMIKIVASRFNDDIETFGYTFDEIYPVNRCSKVVI